MDEPRRVTCVGIDVSKDRRLDVHLRPSGEALPSRRRQRLEHLVDRLLAHDVLLIVLEATGGFEVTAAAAKAAAGLPVAVVNPR
jgi:transposase